MNPVENKHIKFDVIIPVAYKDVSFIGRVINHIIRCIDGIGNIYILTSNRNVNRIRNRIGESDNVSILDEDNIIPSLTFNRIHDLLGIYAPHLMNRTGWYFQQLLKFGFSMSSFASSFYLSWDADTLALAPIKFFEGDNILYNPKKEFNPNYFKTILNLLGIQKINPNSYISEMMMFSTQIVKELIKDIELSTVKGDDWIEKIIASGDYSLNLPTFSEFETYGTYLDNKYPHIYMPRYLNTFREAGLIAGRSISEEKLKRMSFDLDVASFEMCDEPLFPYNYSYIIYKIVQRLKNCSKMTLSDLLNIAFNKRRHLPNFSDDKEEVLYRLPEDRK